MGRILSEPYSIIYALTSEGETVKTEAVRYIGKTSFTAAHRLGKHMVSVRTGCQFHSHNWIRSLVKSGRSPKIHILAIVSHEDSAFFEQLFIQHFRNQGARLTNLTDGGEGPAGRKNTPEQQERHLKRAALRKGVALSAEGAERQRKILEKVRQLPQYKTRGQKRRGEKRPAWIGERISAAKKGNTVVSHEQRAQISRTLTGKKHSPETIAKRRASVNAIRLTAAYKEKHRAAVLAWWSQRKAGGVSSL